jgi:hypothetical protein
MSLHIQQKAPLRTTCDAQPCSSEQLARFGIIVLAEQVWKSEVVALISRSGANKNVFG